VQNMINAEYTFDNFVVGPSNRVAHDTCLKFSLARRYHAPLFLHSDTGLGKSHLIHAIANNALELENDLKIFRISSETLLRDVVVCNRSKKGKSRKLRRLSQRYLEYDLLFVEDVDWLTVSSTTQDTLSEVISLYLSNGKNIVVDGSQGLLDMRFDTRLADCLASFMHLYIDRPNLNERIDIAKSKNQSHKVKFEEKVIIDLAKRCCNNVREIEGGLYRLVAHTNLGY
jgi:chromosomal replication initiator protein